ncbi:MAG TPA: methyltransferase domain-containing protein [Saprospiraceae bacterium]|nr:methyltransferase domain-containing protein [Saprospiraceae bacterium]
MSTTNEELYAEGYLEYLSKRSPIRKIVRLLYLYDIRKYCKSATVDFGCGAGELLKILPKGSVGYEINPYAVRYCNSQGLTAYLYDPGSDKYEFWMIEPNKFHSFTMNHVLEHLEEPAAVMNKIFEHCSRLGISRIVFTVPGTKGYTTDKTHLTFVDMDYLKKNGILQNKYYRLKLSKYFPLNMKSFSKVFTHNELRLVFDKRE